MKIHLPNKDVKKKIIYIKNLNNNLIYSINI